MSLVPGSTYTLTITSIVEDSMKTIESWEKWPQEIIESVLKIKTQVMVKNKVREYICERKLIQIEINKMIIWLVASQVGDWH